MPISHLLLALIVILIWGFNFIFVKFSLEEVSPLLLCAVRFLLASVPAVFFIKPPQAPFRIVASYGLIMFGLQFGLLFIGMHFGMTPGVASLLMQMQVFFSMIFAAIFLREIPYVWQIAGAVISFSGIALVAMHFDENISLVGFLFILAAAATWGMGNLITKKYPSMNMLALVVWGSFVAAFPMLAISFIIEGPGSFVMSWHKISFLGITSILYIVYASTWVGYGIWNWLLGRYPVGVVVPFTLLVPIVALISSVFILNEPFQSWKLCATLLVVGGLCLSFLGTQLFTKGLVLKPNT